MAEVGTLATPVDVSLSRLVPAAVVRRGIQRVFANRLRRAKGLVQNVVCISPWISSTAEDGDALRLILKEIRARAIPAYFLTRRPTMSSHVAAVEAIKECPTAEILFNDNIHAKIYACTGPPTTAFAILGSANLTANSLLLHEIGLLVLGIGPGAAIVDELAHFGTRHLRTRPESEVIKRIDARSVRHVT